MIDFLTLFQIVLASVAPFVLIGSFCLACYEMGKRRGKKEQRKPCV